MSEFKNVTVVKAANVYFDGQVVSRSVRFADGAKKTLGVMRPGEYEFGTGDTQIMEILSGEIDVSLRELRAGGRSKTVSPSKSGQRQISHEDDNSDGLLLFVCNVTRQHSISCPLFSNGELSWLVLTQEPTGRRISIVSSSFRGR